MNMKDIVEALSKHQTILSVVESDKYNAVIADTLKELPQNAEIVYVTLNKTASSLEDYLVKAGVKVDRVTIIDCISKTIQDIRDTERIIYLDSPRALSDLSFVLTGVLKSKKNIYLLFDSLTTLLVYSDKPVVARFLLNIVNRIRDTSCKAALFAVDVEEHKDFFKEVSIFVDQVIKPTG